MKYTVFILIAVAGLAAGEESPSVMNRLKGEIAATDGVILLKEGKTKEALDLLEKARTLDDRNPYVCYNLAEAVDVSGDAERSINELRSTIDKVPQETLKKNADLKRLVAAGWYNLGILLAQKGSLAEALNAFETSLAHNPTDQDAAFNRLLISKLLEERRKQEEENRKKEEELKKILEELAKKIMGLVERQGMTLASFWRGRPQFVPGDEEQQQVEKKETGGGLMGLGKKILKGLAESFTGKDIPPLQLDENLMPEQVAAWVKAVFVPQPTENDEVLEIVEINIAGDARKISQELVKIAEMVVPARAAAPANARSQPQENPLADALKQSAKHLDVGAVHADGASTGLKDGKPENVNMDMTLAEREFLLALAPFLQPPQAQKKPDDKNQEKQDNKQEQQQEKQGEQQKEQSAEEKKDDKEQAEEKEAQAEQLTPEEAKKLLEAMKQDDKEALRELLERRVKTSGRTNVEKDW